MNNSDHASRTVGRSVIARKEGAQIGDVAQIFFDPDSRSISGMTSKTRVFAPERWFGVDDIELIGKDVVLLGSETSLTPINHKGIPRGKSFKDLRGMWVVTVDGARLGRLVDLKIHQQGWVIEQLVLDHNRVLDVDSADIRIVKGKILVPADYSDRVTSEKVQVPLFFRRVYHSRRVRHAARFVGEAIDRFLETADH